MTPRRWLNAMYILAWIGAMEIALEQFLRPLPMALTWLIRSVQLTSLMGAIICLWNVTRLRVPENEPEKDEFIDSLLDATHRTQEYVRDAFAHTLGGALVLSLLAAYGALVYEKFFWNTPDAAYYFSIMTVAFLTLSLAWAIPSYRMRRELKRLRDLPSFD